MTTQVLTTITPIDTLLTTFPDYNLESTGASTKHEALSVNDGSDNYIWANTNGATDAFLYSSPDTIPASATITKVEIVTFMEANTTVAQNLISIVLFRAGNSETIATQGLPGSWDEFTFDVSSNRPGGGSWVPADFNATGVGNTLDIRFDHLLTTRRSHVTYAAIEVTYDLPPAAPDPCPIFLDSSLKRTQPLSGTISPTIHMGSSLVPTISRQAAVEQKTSLSGIIRQQVQLNALCS